MGLCENMRQGSAGVFRAGVGLLLLGLSLAQADPQHTACPAVAPQNLTLVPYQDTEEDTTAGFMASFVQSFLHTVQPKPLPVDLVLKIVKDAEHSWVDQDNIKEQIDYVVSESYKTVQEVTVNLLGIGPQLGTEIMKRFGAILDPALDSIKLLDQAETVNIDAQLKKLNSSLVQLQSSLDLLHGNVSAVKRRIRQTLSNSACIGCSNINLQRLDVLDITISTSQQLLNEIKKQISQVTSDIPLSSLINVSGTLHDVQREIGKITPEVKKVEHIRWGICVVLCCFVLLVVVCNLLGLALGPMGLKPREDPTKRSCTADCGGTFFMMGAGFSFIFSWLLMIVVLVLFLLGGSAYTLICKPWNNGELFEIIDTPGLIPGLEIGPALGLKTNINISDIYKDCKKNQALWTTLHLYELVNLNELLNVSQYTKEIQQYFDNADITLTTVTLLSPEIKKELTDFSATAKDFDFTHIYQQMNNISSFNLNTTADLLDGISERQTNSQIKNELQNEARDLRRIQSNMERSITPQMENLNSTIKRIQSSGEKINGTVGEVLSNVEAAQDFLNTNSTQIIKTESRKFLDCQLGYFNAYAKWANITITQQVGRCGPVAGSVDSAENLLCANIVESLNAFWFSLGWCIIFFIPSIIFTIKLAKYYRKMKSSDVFE
ncbi:Prominin-1-A [Nibea albiflora]|uniref:Prominin-1-A n=1 Tax=Nibea albiflora TaxID=240163 RepID=A0ACB7EGW8_NIBAL|nr:Prominin-1-A [Nibea albiflora]